MPKEPTRTMTVADVEIYLKAAEWIVRHEEWFANDSAKQTLAVLDDGLERAKAATAGQDAVARRAGQAGRRAATARGSTARCSRTPSRFPAGYGKDRARSGGSTSSCTAATRR